MYSYSSASRTNEIKTKEADSPLDTVSSLVWHRYSQDPMFFATSWDGYIRCYMVKNYNSSSSTQLQLVYKIFLEHPVLCCDIHQDNILFVGMATGDIAAINLADSQIMRIGAHDAPICGVFWLKQKRRLMTLGFDSLVRFWDLESNKGSPEGQIKLPLKTHVASYDAPYLLIGSCQSTVALVNLKNFPNVKFPREASNYFKTTIQLFSKFNCASINAGAKMLAVGTIDGRTLHASFKESYDDFSIEPMVSKSQKKTEGYNKSLYGQVNAVDVGYRNYEGFCFVGGTQDLSGYNLKKKNKASSASFNFGPITALKLHPSQDMIVFATGTDWMRGMDELDKIKRPKIHLSILNSSQIQELIGK